MNPITNLLEAMGQTFGGSYFPDAPENANNPDFQSGYQVGLLNDDLSIANQDHPITVEWRRRGLKDKVTNAAFETWKRGYWSGRYTAIASEPKVAYEQEVD